MEVLSLSQTEQVAMGHKWCSDGTDGIYTISEAREVTPGTKVVLHLKKDSAEFSKESVVESIIRKYSNFIGVPVFLNGKQLNVVDPLWLKDPSKVCIIAYPICRLLLSKLVASLQLQISEEEYTSFYQFFVGNKYDSPRYRTSFQTDSPINLRALLFIPTLKPSIFEAVKETESSLSLYCRKVGPWSLDVASP